MLVCGGHHTIILNEKNEKNEIYVCGNNDFGQLGLGTNKNEYQFRKIDRDFGKIKNIACGTKHTIIQNEKNEVYVCGSNKYGQLGMGDDKSRNRLEKVDFNFGDIKNIVCGGYYTIIQNEKNEIYACGHSAPGQLGFGDGKRRNKFERVKYDFGKIENIACGDCHTVIQNKMNKIYMSGWNMYGQLGFGDYDNRHKFEEVGYDFGEIKNIACGDSYTIIQNKKNEIYVCGCNSYGQLGLGDYKSRTKFEKVEFDFGGIKNIICGDRHVVIQNEKNEIYVCGNNIRGQLGLGDNEHRNRFEKVKKNFGEIKKISLGGYYMVIQNEENEIYVCGDNNSGQLGLCNNEYENIFQKVNTDDIFEKKPMNAKNI